MKIEVDTHTHTVLSGHAHSTILENAAAAARNGIKGLVMTDHGPMIPSAPPEFNINTLSFIPKNIDGVRIYRGIEANIISFGGELDIKDKFLNKLDFVIAGLHEVVISSGGAVKDMEAVLGALNNRHVDIISHPDNPYYSLDYETFIKETARLGKLIEINNHSLEYRDKGLNNTKIILGLCRKHGVRVSVSSDAHFAYGVGEFDTALGIIHDEGFPEELIVNLTMERFEEYLRERKERIAAEN